MCLYGLPGPCWKCDWCAFGTGDCTYDDEEEF